MFLGNAMQIPIFHNHKKRVVSNTAGYFVNALDAGEAHEVEMDKAEFAEFKKDGIGSVGTVEGIRTLGW
ncbi:hypothetical protein GP486_004296 [Trichoglossum hirsutum]|uniref:Uncharacterized protein n=1 Tax=Trichoglossum hirsutum TaxID=265104 RepID=A0A9P8LBN0_9PEZI|nr:hypothetical protein GP486_004296 [Trichoglossum hirsutum]